MALTKIKGAGINISATEKLYFDGGGTTYIQESADGVLDFYADNVKMLELLEGATDYVWIPVDATKFAIGAGKDLNIYTSSDDAIIENITSDKDIIFKGNDGGSTITALTLDISAAGAATFNDKIIATELDISGNMDIDGTSNLDAVDIDGAVQIDATVTVGADDQGYDVIFYGDTASSNMTWDTSADDLVLNDARLYINQDDNSVSIDIDSEATTEPVIQVDSPASTTHPIINLTNLDSLTTGEGLRVHSNSSSNSSRILVSIINDHASAVNTIPLKIQQDSLNVAVAIDDPKCTADNIMQITNADALTSGGMLYLESDSSDNSTRNLLTVINDNASADNTVGLYIKQDGADASIELAGNGSIKFPGTQGASSDANSLDDYEEGTWTPSLSGASSHPTNSFDSRGGFYTKIGNRVFWSMRFSMSGGSAITPGSGTLSVDGLPFTVRNDESMQGGIAIGHSANWLTGQHGAPTGGFYNTNTTAFSLVVYDNDGGNIAGMSYADAADVDESTTLTASGDFII